MSLQAAQQTSPVLIISDRFRSNTIGYALQVWSAALQPSAPPCQTEATAASGSWKAMSHHSTQQLTLFYWPSARQMTCLHEGKSRWQILLASHLQMYPSHSYSPKPILTPPPLGALTLAFCSCSLRRRSRSSEHRKKQNSSAFLLALLTARLLGPDHSSGARPSSEL